MDLETIKKYESHYMNISPLPHFKVMVSREMFNSLAADEKKLMREQARIDAESATDLRYKFKMKGENE